MQYEIVIGLETHAELLTETKLFCGCLNRFGSPPNSLVCPVCLGLPGVLPVMSKKGFEMALKAALALNCKINQFTAFDRKNYYYPDLPKNYQISQNYINLGVDGYLEIKHDGEKKRIRIHNVHLEEEAGKLMHPEESGDDYSLVDFNRAGVPLLEIVTYPDMRSLEEVEAYMNTLRTLLLYLEVSDCKMQEGSLRFEASVSLKRQGQEALGNRVEIKNVNSMKAVLKALEYEIKRQREVMEGDGVVTRETRLWDDLRGRTERMRTKEEAQDYRYFPEPDLLPVVIDNRWLGELTATLPELPLSRKERFVAQYGLSEYDAGVLTENKSLADYFEGCVVQYKSPKVICNWVINDVLRELNERRLEIRNFPVSSEMLVELTKLVEEGDISMPTARGVFVEMVETGKKAPQIVQERGLLQISDRVQLENIVQEVLTENPSALADYKKGKKTSLTFLVGQIMRKTKGKANPQLINELLKLKLEASQ